MLVTMLLLSLLESPELLANPDLMKQNKTNPRLRLRLTDT
jgi:hypothetical protein